MTVPKLGLFGQAAHGTTALHPTLSDPAHTAATRLLPMQTISYPPSITHALAQHSSKANKADDLSPHAAAAPARQGLRSIERNLGVKATVGTPQ